MLLARHQAASARGAGAQVAKRRRVVGFVPRAGLGSSSSSSQSPSPYDALIEALVPLVGAATTSPSSPPASAAAAVPPPALRAAFDLADQQQQDEAAQQQSGGWVLAGSSSNSDNEPSSSSSLAPLLVPLSLNPTLVLARVAQLERAARDRSRRSQLASLGASLSTLIAEREARLAERLLSENAAAADSRRRYKEWKDEEVQEDEDGIGSRRFSVAVGGGDGGVAATALDDLYSFGERLERDERLERERAARDRQREERRREEFLMDPTVGDRLRAEVEATTKEQKKAPPPPPTQRQQPPAPPKIAPELGSASFFMTGKTTSSGSADNSALAMATARLRARLAQVDEEKQRRGLVGGEATTTTQPQTPTTFEARSILAHLLREYEYPEERAAMLPEACTLPGMATRVEGGRTGEVTLRTTPADLRAAIEEEKRRGKSQDVVEALDELLVDLEGYERVWKVVNGVD